MRLDSRAALACPEFLHKTHAPKRFDLRNLAPETPMAKAMSDQGFIHEARVIEKLKASVSGYALIEPDMPTDVREAETVKALRDASNAVVIHPVFGQTAEQLIAEGQGVPWVDGHPRNSRPDLIVRISADPAPFGTWAAVDIKSHGAFDKKNKSNEVTVTALSTPNEVGENPATGRLKDDDAMQLAHYQRHLEFMGIASDETWAGIIGRDGDFVAWARLSETNFGRGRNEMHALGKYDLQFARAQSIVHQAALRNDDPSVQAPAMPMYDGAAKKCPTCAFLPICLDEMVKYRESGNVTLLAEVSPTKAANELPIGIGIRELAEYSQPLSDFGEVAKQRARVYVSGKPEIKVGVSDFAVPTFDVEIDIDLENSQGALQDIGFNDSVEPDRLYLYGYITHDRTVDPDWHTAQTGTFEDYAGNREGEHSVYLRMWEYLQAQISKAQSGGKTIGIFHYSSHELTWWRKWVTNFYDLPGTPTSDEMESFIANYMCDLYPVAQQIVFPANSKSPVCNYSIKTLAPLAGFTWHADDAGGANSLLKYKEAMSGAEPEARNAQEWLRKYNVDDVKATMALRNWLRAFHCKF